jgi:hypothetical protein
VGAEQHCRRVLSGSADDPLGVGIERGEARGERIVEWREVGLRDHQGVGDCRLPRRFGKAVEGRETGNRIDQGHHPAEPQAVVEHRVGAEREEYGSRVGEPAGFDDDPAEPSDLARVTPLDEAAQGLRQILAHRAAQAPARQLQHAAFDKIHQIVVDRDFADLVNDDGGVGEFRRGQGPAQQRRFAAAEKAGQHRHRQAAMRRSAIHRKIP